MQFIDGEEHAKGSDRRELCDAQCTHAMHVKSEFIDGEASDKDSAHRELCDAQCTHDTKSKFIEVVYGDCDLPGDFGFKVLTSERLTKTAIIAMFFQDGVTGGSESELGEQVTSGFWGPWASPAAARRMSRSITAASRCSRP